MFPITFGGSVIKNAKSWSNTAVLFSKSEKTLFKFQTGFRHAPVEQCVSFSAVIRVVAHAGSISLCWFDNSVITPASLNLSNFISIVYDKLFLLEKRSSQYVNV